MGRHKTIYIDKAAMLRNIHRQHTEQVAEFKAKAPWLKFSLRELTDFGPRCDVATFVGRLLSPSERVRAQEALRSLEADGLLSVYGMKATRVRLTDAGVAYLAALDAKAPAQ